MQSRISSRCRKTKKLVSHFRPQKTNVPQGKQTLVILYLLPSARGCACRWTRTLDLDITRRAFYQQATAASHEEIPYFINYNVHTSIVRTWISQWFLAKNFFLYFNNNFTRINNCKFIHHKTHLKPFLSYLPCIVHREYFSIIFNVKNEHYIQ